MVKFYCDITTRLRDIGEEDSDMMLNLINLYYEQYPNMRKEISDAAEQKISQQVKNAAHTLKGVCLNLGIEPMSDVCKSIEEASLGNDWEKIISLVDTLDKHFAKSQEIFAELANEYS